MFELVVGLQVIPLAQEQPLLDQLIEVPAQREAIALRQRGQLTQREAPADHGSLPRQLLLLLGKRIQPGQEQLLQRDGQGAHRGRSAAGSGLGEHHAGQLLDEEGNAFRPPHQELDCFRGQIWPIPGEPLHHLGGFLRGEPVQHEPVEARMPPPGEPQLGALAQHQTHPRQLDALLQEVEQLQGGRVGPVQILQDEEQGARRCLPGDSRRQPQQEGGQQLQGVLPLLLG